MASPPLPPPLKFQPKAAQRRTPAERAAHARAELDRQRARTAAAASPSAGSVRGVGFRGGFRGGLSGWRTERRPAGAASGPLSGPTVGEGARGRGRGAERGRGGGGVGSGRGETGRGRSAAAGKGKARATVKKEEETAAEVLLEEVDEDDEDDDDENETGRTGRRINIDLINLVSDDDDDDPSAVDGHRQPVASTSTAGRAARSAADDQGPSQRRHTLRPVRLAREDHPLRSAAALALLASSQSRSKGRARVLHGADDELFVSDEDDHSDGQIGDRLEAEMKRTKTKSPGEADGAASRRDSGTATGRTSRGVGRTDEEDEDDFTIENQDEHAARDALQPTASTSRRHRFHDSTAHLATDNTSTRPPAPPKPTARPPRLRAPAPAPADLAEWHRAHADRRALAEELGPSSSLLSSSTAASASQHATRPDYTDLETPLAVMADTEQDHAEAEREHPHAPDTFLPRDRRAGFAYVFQLPPLLPPLVTPTGPTASSSTTASSSARANVAAAAAGAVPLPAQHHRPPPPTHVRLYRRPCAHSSTSTRGSGGVDGTRAAAGSAIVRAVTTAAGTARRPRRHADGLRERRGALDVGRRAAGGGGGEAERRVGGGRCGGRA